VRSFFLAPSRICHLCVCVQCSDDQIDGQVRREEALDRRSSIDRHLWMGDEICSRPIRRGSHHKFIARAPRTYETRRVCARRPAGVSQISSIRNRLVASDRSSPAPIEFGRSTTTIEPVTLVRLDDAMRCYVQRQAALVSSCDARTDLLYTPISKGKLHDASTLNSGDKSCWCDGRTGDRKQGGKDSCGNSEFLARPVRSSRGELGGRPAGARVGCGAARRRRSESRRRRRAPRNQSAQPGGLGFRFLPPVRTGIDGGDGDRRGTDGDGS
jgi:hypothetical protein